MDELLKEEILAALMTAYESPTAITLLAHLEELFNEELDPSDLEHFLDKIILKS